MNMETVVVIGRSVILSDMHSRSDGSFVNSKRDMRYVPSKKKLIWTDKSGRITSVNLLK